MTSFDLQGTRVAIAHLDGAFYAFSDTCPHDADSLSEGRLEGMVVVCQSDGSRFDVASGRVLSGPAEKRLRTYRIQVRGDDLVI
jgi:3-phenylpropionate/trans-cinnamate dioxygenase ferredoxin subunit